MSRKKSDLTTGLILVFVSGVLTLLSTIMDICGYLPALQKVVQSTVGAPINMGLMLIGLVLLLIGLFVGAKEEPFMKYGGWCVLGNLFVTALSIGLLILGLFKWPVLLSTILYVSIVIKILTLATSLLVVESCQSRYFKKKMTKELKYGFVVETILVLTTVLSIILTVLYKGDTKVQSNALVYAIMIIISAALEFVASAMYLVYLGIVSTKVRRIV